MLSTNLFHLLLSLFPTENLHFVAFGHEVMAVAPLRRHADEEADEFEHVIQEDVRVIVLEGTLEKVVEEVRRIAVLQVQHLEILP